MDEGPSETMALRIRWASVGKRFLVLMVVCYVPVLVLAAAQWDLRIWRVFLVIPVAWPVTWLDNHGWLRSLPDKPVLVAFSLFPVVQLATIAFWSTFRRGVFTVAGIVVFLWSAANTLYLAIVVNAY